MSGIIPIASSLYTLHEGRQVREEGIGGGKLLRALCDLGVKAIGFWYYAAESETVTGINSGHSFTENALARIQRTVFGKASRSAGEKMSLNR